MSPSASYTPKVLAQLSEISIDLADVEQLLREGWRDQVVAGVASLFHPDPKACLPLLWRAFDSGSWASPQLGLCAMLLAPDDPTEVRRRLLLRCPVCSTHLEGTDPQWRHVEHGSASVDSHSTKAMAALLESCARSPEGRAWLVSHLSFADAYWALEVDFWDDGVSISRHWSNAMGPMLTALGRSVPAWLLTDSPENLLGMWDIQAQPRVVRSLSQGSWQRRLYQLFVPFVRAGHLSLVLEGDEHHLHLSSRTPGGNQTLLQLDGPYYDAIWRRLEFETRSGKIFPMVDQGPDLAALQVEHIQKGLSIQCQREFQYPSDFELSERKLEDCPAQIWLIGIDSQCRFDGGVAAVVAQLGGEELVESVCQAMAVGNRSPGQLCLASSEQLRKHGIRKVAFMITLPQPTLAQLCEGLESVLSDCKSEGYSRLAMPALGCGAAGFKASEVAGPMLAVLARYREHFWITLSLPREIDRGAFQAAARSQGLIP